MRKGTAESCASDRSPFKECPEGGREVCINHRLSKQKVHITENAAVYYSKLSTSKAPRDVRLFEIILYIYILYVHVCASVCMYTYA